MRNDREQIVLAAKNVFELELLQPYANAVAQATGRRVSEALLSPDTFWLELNELLLRCPCSLVVMRRPDEPVQMRGASVLNHRVDLMLISHQPHKELKIGRVLAPWSGDTNALAGIRLASALARQWNVPAEVLRVMLPVDPLGVDYRQIQQWSRLQMELAEVELPLRFRVAEDIVSEVLLDARPDDLVVVGTGSDGLFHQYPLHSICWDIAQSVSGPSAILLSAASRVPTLTKVFWERSIQMQLQAGSEAEAVRLLAENMAVQRQIPWHLKEAVISKALQRGIAVSNGAGILHARVEGCNGVLGAMGIFQAPVRTQLADGQIRMLFLLLAPTASYDSYLPTLAKIGRLLSDDHAVGTILGCTTPAEVIWTLQHLESQWEEESVSARAIHSVGTAAGPAPTRPPRPIDNLSYRRFGSR